MPSVTEYIDSIFEDRGPAQAVIDAAYIYASEHPMTCDVGGTGLRVTIERIDVDKDSRGIGIGNGFMLAVCRAADRAGVTIELEVGSGEDEPSDVDLVQWYSKFGFVWKGGYMQRDPGASPKHKWSAEHDE